MTDDWILKWLKTKPLHQAVWGQLGYVNVYSILVDRIYYLKTYYVYTYTYWEKYSIIYIQYLLILNFISMVTVFYGHVRNAIVGKGKS